MNKTQLIEQLQKPVDQVDSLLKVAGISTELETYSDEHLKTLQTIDEMVSSGKAKTPKDAAKLYRQQQETTTASSAVMPASEIDKFILAQAERAAEAELSKIPQVAQEENIRLRTLFVQRYRQYIAERLQDPEYREKFQAAIEGQDLGKSELLGSTTSNTALPSSSFSSS